MHPKIWCLNFKPQYLQKYLSPTNDLYSVRKRRSGLSNQFSNCWAGGPLARTPCAQSFLREVLRWRAASPHWLRTLRQNFARVVSLAAVQLVLKHARAPLT